MLVGDQQVDTVRHRQGQNDGRRAPHYRGHFNPQPDDRSHGDDDRQRNHQHGLQHRHHTAQHDEQTDDNGHRTVD